MESKKDFVFYRWRPCFFQWVVELSRAGGCDVTLDGQPSKAYLGELPSYSTHVTTDAPLDICKGG